MLKSARHTTSRSLSRLGMRSSESWPEYIRWLVSLSNIGRLNSLKCCFGKKQVHDIITIANYEIPRTRPYRTPRESNAVSSHIPHPNGDETPLVSVIICTYNRPDYLAKAIA